MRKIFFTLIALMGALGLSAQTASAEVRTLVVRTSDGNTSRFNLADIEEITFDDAPARQSRVVRLLNLSPEFLSVSGIGENQVLTPGETAVLTLNAGSILSGEFQDYHFEHLHIHVNDRVIVPVTPEGYQPAGAITVPFTVPDEDCDIVVCYSVQQQKIDTGFTMSLEENPHVTLYGVDPAGHYKYFDAYLLVDEAYVITDVEYRMGNGDWTSVEATDGCTVSPDDNLPNLYRIKIRPDYRNVTGDVTLRVAGEQHHRYNISWNNAEATYLDLEKSTFPTRAIDGDVVTAELYVNDSYYLNGASASDGTEVETLHRAYVRFTMPANDVTVTLDILHKIPVAYTASDHVAEAKFYDAPDIYYGRETSLGIPGEEVYLIASAQEGYKPMTATTDDGHTFSFKHYGLDMYLCPVTISGGVSSMSATVSCSPAWTVTSGQQVQFDEGSLYASGETVKFAMKVPDGKKIDTVTAVTASGQPVEVALDTPYGSFVMPAEDVTLTVTYADLPVGDQVSVIAYYDDDQYRVSSSTNYDWDFAEGFRMDKGATFYLSVLDYYGEDFYVGVKIGETVETYHASQDEDSGEYSFGKALVANGDITIKVGPSRSSVAF